MNVADLFRAFLSLGLPVAALSWVLFSWIFSSGEIGRGEKRAAIKKQVKKLRSLDGLRGKTGRKLVFDKWVKSGTGFYGLAGLWTLVVIEAGELLEFLTDPDRFASMDEAGIAAFILGIVVNQLTNVIQAMIWWSYWPADSLLVWVSVAYVSFWSGVELARRSKAQSVSEVLTRIRDKNTPKSE
jgi:hypothetical protein